MISKTQQEFLFGMLIGGAIGASTAFFLAPLPGLELRRQMLNGFAHPHSTKPKRKAVSQKKPRKIVTAKRNVAQTRVKKKSEHNNKKAHIAT